MRSRRRTLKICAGNMSAKKRRFLGLLAVLMLLPVVVLAQATYTAQLSGVVTDSSGGVVPGAKVVLLHCVIVAWQANPQGSLNSY